MKWLKSRKNFLIEATVGDRILPPQKKEVIRQWGEKWLDMEEVIPTEHIKQGDFELSEEDKFKVLDALFGCDVKAAQDQYKDLPEKFINMVQQSLEFLKESTSTDTAILRAKEVLEEVDLNNIGIDEMVALNGPVLRKLSNETGKNEMIQKDENGRPVMGDDGRPVKIAKEVGEPVFEKNLINLESFRQEYNKYFDKVDRDFNDRNLQRILNVIREDVNGEFKTSFKLFNQPVYLRISHNPKDILNMSISKFYQSCQHLYTGGYRRQLLGNVFDPNSIPAFLVIKTPIFNGKELISEQLPLSRSIVRYLDGFGDGSEPKFFFDRVYPERLRNVMYDTITKYTGMQSSGTHGDRKDVRTYTYALDLPAQVQSELDTAYQDSLGTQKKRFIGVNTKRLSTSMSMFKDAIISKHARVEELIVDSPDVSEELFKLPLNLNWIKFKFIDIKRMPDMSKFSCKSFAFDKCKFTNAELLKAISDNPEMEKLQLTSCEVDDLKLDGVNVDELQLVYTTSGSLPEVLGGAKFKKLVLSGDLLSDKSNKEYINNLKKSGVSVETIGLVI